MILKRPSATIIGWWKSLVATLDNFYAKTVNAALTVFFFVESALLATTKTTLTIIKEGGQGKK